MSHTSTQRVYPRDAFLALAALRQRVRQCPNFDAQCSCGWGQCRAGRGNLAGVVSSADCRACLDEPDGPWRGITCETTP